MKMKKNCKDELLENKNRLAVFYTNNLKILILLGSIFLFLEWCLQPCLLFLVK
jgi:hypothetical protein